MREKHTDSVQNRFTAYLMAAVDNTRKKYWERKRRLQGREFIQEDNLERNYTDFEEQYRAYIGEHTDFIFRVGKRYGELLNLLESDRLAKAISRLKDRDREILFARVYGELTFAELGERFHRSFKRLPGTDHRFQVPLILNEVGGIFYAPLAQMGGAQGIKNIPDF